MNFVKAREDATQDFACPVCGLGLEDDASDWCGECGAPGSGEVNGKCPGCGASLRVVRESYRDLVYVAKETKT